MLSFAVHIRRYWLIVVSAALPLFSNITARAAGDGSINYGASKVNSMAPTAGVRSSGNDAYDYLALHNQTGPSGVPLGGIGVGYFCYCPDGRFTRIAINGWHDQGGGQGWPIIKNTRGTFLALWSDGKAELLHRGDSFLGMPPAQNTVYRGLFPTAECRVDQDVVVRAWSSLIPQDVKDSSLPLAWIMVTLKNRESQPQDMAVAFSWEDVIGRQICDVPNEQVLRDKRFANNAWGRREMQEKLLHGHWSYMPRVPTAAEPFGVSNYQGIRQWSAPLKPIMKTFQNYNNQVAILAEQLSGAEISCLPAYSVTDGDQAWKTFRTEGRFPAAQSQPLFDPAQGKEKASAIAVRMRVGPGETKTVRFLVAWFRPELTVDPIHDAPASFFGKNNYNPYYRHQFQSLNSLLTYAIAERDRLLTETRAWQQPILQSTYPDWLKFKVINSAYTLFTNTILNENGDFAVMEGGMGGLSGTMDQRICAHPFYFKFFTQLDRRELEMFGHTPGKDGQILHFDGNYYVGLASRDGTTPVPDSWMNDNTGGWLLQIAKDYQQSGDLVWLRQFDAEIHASLRFLRSRIQSKRFQIITGPTTYDDFWHPDLYAYNATTYPTFLQAGTVLLDALGDRAGAQECHQQAITSAHDATKALWNGQYFAYGADLDGSHRRDDIIFSGQLAGPFLSRYCCWEDIFPFRDVQASIVSQLKTNIAHSPDYYAPKVWLIKENRAMNDPNRPNDPHADSTCWPFYLESYTAMAAIQAGYVDDGLEIMRHIQLVNLRNGWTWSQNLWRPGELTYVCAPVSWFITDILAGSGLDVPAHTLYLSPIMQKNQHRVVMPVYFPRFWATVTTDRDQRKLTFKVTKVFDGPDIVINQVIAQPAGKPSSARTLVQVPSFTVRDSAILDLSQNFDALTADQIEKPALLHANKAQFSEK